MNQPSLSDESATTHSQSSLRAVSSVTLLSTIHLGLQFSLQLFVAWLYGAGPDVDAYVAAMTLPAILSAVLCGAIPSAFVPVFAERQLANRPGETERLVLQTQLLLITVMGLLSLGLFIAAEWWIRVLFPGFSTPQAKLATELLQIVCWLTLLNSLTNFLYAVCQAQGEFTRPPLASVLGILLTLACLWFGGSGWSIHGVAWSVVAGTGLTVLILLPRLTFSWRRSWGRTDVGLSRVLNLLWPLILAGIYFRIEPLVDRYLASNLDSGGVARLGYAWRVANALALLIPSGIIAVTFPAIASRAAEENWTTLKSEISRSIRLMIVLVTPVIASIAVYAPAIIRTLFEHGEFLPSDTIVVAALLRGYCGLIVGLGLGEILARVLHALQDVRTPVACGFIALAIGVGLKFTLISRFGLPAIAVATSVAMLLNTVLLAAAVFRRFGDFQFGLGVLRTLVQSISASTIACLIVKVTGEPVSPSATVGLATLGGLVYLGMMLVFRNEFLVATCQAIRARMLRE